MATLTFYKTQCDAILCGGACVCVLEVQQLTAGDKPDPTSLSELSIMSECAYLVCSVGVGSADSVLDRKFHLNGSQKKISKESVTSCSC